MENILVVPTETLRPYLTDRGLIRGKEAELYAIIEKEHTFIPRPDAEKDPSYKQIIPYITLCRKDEVFCTRRTNKGGEARLHGRLSLGIGGHINTLDDMESGDIFRRGLQRELEEEVYLTGGGELIPIGVINDDTNEVGSVHLGFFFTMEVTDAAVRETDKLEGLWLKRSELNENMENMETWSQIACEALI
jgi:predicted NUDIX family phosphoesterase